MKTPEGKEEGTGCLLTRPVVEETWKQSEHQQGRGRLGMRHRSGRKLPILLGGVWEAVNPLHSSQRCGRLMHVESQPS